MRSRDHLSFDSSVTCHPAEVILRLYPGVAVTQKSTSTKILNTKLVYNAPISLSQNKKSQSNLRRAALPPLTTENNYATESQLVTVGRLTFTPKPPLSLRRSPPHLIHSSIDRSHSLPEMASGSNEPFCYSTPSRHTDRPIT